MGRVIMKKSASKICHLKETMRNSMNLGTLAFPFDLGPWQQLDFVLPLLVFQTKFHHARHWNTVPGDKYNGRTQIEFGSRPQPCVPRQPNPFQVRKKGGHWPLEGRGVGLDGVQAQNLLFHNMEEWKSEIVKLWMTTMSNSNCPKSWWNQCPGAWLKSLRKRGLPLDVWTENKRFCVCC